VYLGSAPFSTKIRIYQVWNSSVLNWSYLHLGKLPTSAAKCNIDQPSGSVQFTFAPIDIKRLNKELSPCPTAIQEEEPIPQNSFFPWDGEPLGLAPFFNK